MWNMIFIIQNIRYTLYVVVLQIEPDLLVSDSTQNQNIEKY